MTTVQPTSNGHGDNAADARQHYRVTFWVLALSAMSYALSQSLVIPALPTIQRDLHTSESSVAWVLTAYLLSASVATPVLGRLGDMYGKRRVLVFTLGALTVGTLIAAVSQSMGLLIAGRFIQGAAGGVFPLAFGIIRDEFPAKEVPGGIGLMSSLLGVGGGAGVVLAGPILEHLSYHWLFWLPLVLCVISTIATARFVPESPIKRPGRINWAAGAAMAVGLITVLIAVSETTDWGWGSFKTLGLIAAGLLILVGWVTIEVRSEVPLIDMRVMRIRGVWATNLVGFLLGVGMYSSFILIPQYVQEPHSTGYGFAASVATGALFLLPSTVTMALAGQTIGPLERRFGSRSLLVVGGVFSASSFILLTAARAHGWEVLVASGLLGGGIGLAFATMANLIVENVRQDQTGAATGMNTVMRTLGGALGGQVAATLLAGQVINGSPTQHGYTLAFGLCAVALVLGFFSIFLIPRRGRQVVSVAPPVTVDELAREAAVVGD